ncbi:MAG: DUF6326 family protein [Anaerolineae bacterium]|jgi:hypothetical protein
MTSEVKTKRVLHDVTISVKIKLAALWAALMFFYLYRDVLGFMEPGHVEDLLAGELGGVAMTEAVLLGSAALMAIPSVMVFLSLALKASVNRWVNLVLGIAHIALLAGTFFVGSITTLYTFYAIAELLLMLLIVWHAWTWPRLEEARTIAQSPAGRYST